VVKVEFTPRGFVVVEMAIRPHNAQTMEIVSYKVDTGANCTTISKERLLGLGYDENWIKSGRRLKGGETPTAATGLPIADCYEVTLPEIRIGDWVGYNWPFITSLSASFKLLLGTNSMQFFNWNFNYGMGFCEFALIPGKRKILFNNVEQSIHTIDEIK